MKTARIVTTALIYTLFLTIAAYAGDPTGTWSWTTEGRNGPRKVTAELQLKEGALTGSIEGRNGSTAIENASFEGNKIAFDISVGRDGRTRTMSYEGTLGEGTITGTITRPRHNGGESKPIDWKATKL
ncbi:hypothetical protein MLD52_06975 [Puniceicoccaceae bacterium K14]|nr:hypothetical protein [Puniceicoccaceae bacterium K14]